MRFIVDRRSDFVLYGSYMSNFAMGTILGKGFPQAQVHTVHSTSAESPPIVDITYCNLLVENATSPWGQSWERIFHKPLVHTVHSTRALVLVENLFPRLSPWRN